jgi:hypothetical protein
MGTGSTGGDALINPGRKKLAGETLPAALMPLQPTREPKPVPASSTSMMHRFKFTWAI